MEVMSISGIKDAVVQLRKQADALETIFLAETNNLPLTKSPEINSIKIAFEMGKIGCIDAIKKIMELGHCGLVEAKLLIDSWKRPGI